MKTVSIKYCFLALVLIIFIAVNPNSKASVVGEGSASIEFIQAENTMISDTPGIFSYDHQIFHIEPLFSYVQINYFYPGQSFALRKESIRTVHRFSSYLQI